MKLYPIYILLLLVLFSSCKENNPAKQQPKIDKKVVKKHLETANKYLVKAEDQNIRDYIHRHGYQMKETGSGLFYEIYETSNGQQAIKGKIAQMNYDIFLLTGEKIYSSEKEGLKEFLIGKGGVESGLEEAILLMKVGERARIIIPSHLAYGLLGDLQKIPEKASIVYDIELVNLIEKANKTVK